MEGRRRHKREGGQWNGERGGWATRMGSSRPRMVSRQRQWIKGQCGMCPLMLHVCRQCRLLLLQLLQMLLLLHALQICFTIPNLYIELIQFVSSLSGRCGGEGTG